MYSVAELGRLSLESILEKNQTGALARISQALRGLLNIRNECRELENILGLEDGAESDLLLPPQIDEDMPSFLRLVIATLKDMVAMLVSEVEDRPEIQKLLLLIQNFGTAATDRALLQDAVIKEQSSCQVGANPKPCRDKSKVDNNSVMESQAVKRVSVETLEVGCRHSCEHHPELMDRSLWSTLPQELVELVLARLPMQQLVELCKCSQVWSALSKSPDFRRECSKRHPKLFGLVGWKEYPGRTVSTVVYDIESNDWSYRELGLGFPNCIRADDRNAYDGAFFSCDGGLVCYVSQASLAAHPILVGNPLTDEWRVLPRMPCLMLADMDPVLVQLVMEEDGKSYRVILVCANKSDIRQDYSAHCYDSKTYLWSLMESGLVYDGCSTLVWTVLDAPCVFDCETKTLYELIDYPALEAVNAKRYAMVKDHLFVLHKWSSDMFPHVAKRFIVSEYEWQSSASDLSRLRIIDSTLPRDLPREIYEVHLFACNGFLLLIADNCEEDEDQHQLIRLYDSSVNDWQSLSMGGDFRFTEYELQSIYMCELRWDVVP